MKHVEILAPVGNMSCFKAALLAGADAVYLGGIKFGARSFADNFSNEELKELVKEAHLYNVKVYVTLNTLIYDDEVSEFLEYVSYLVKINVDALIMQDIGMIDLVRKTYPNMEIHASTQMHIHNLEGVKLAHKLGIKRVVLSRELSIDEIKNIKENTDVEIEAFIHGALCVSYSGECLMSSLIGGRSGNRGTCAQCCRQKYSLISDDVNVKDKYLLSMKDLNTIDHVKELIDAGIDSLKIEGRMKRPEYVYLVTSIYRKAVDSYLSTGTVKISDNDKLELLKIFNRKFTKGYIFNEDMNNITNDFRPNHMGIEIGEVVKSSNNKVSIKLTSDVRINDGIRFVDDDKGYTLNNFYIGKNLVKEAHANDIITFNYTNVLLNQKVVKTTDSYQIETISNLINREIPKINLKAKIMLRMHALADLRISDGKNVVCAQGDRPIFMAKTAPVDKERVVKQIKKTGNTPYEITDVEVSIDDNIFISMGEINDLRRRVIEELNELRMYQIEVDKKEYNIEVEDYKKTKNKTVKINSLEQYELIKNKDFESIYTDRIDIYIQINSDSRVKFIQQRVMKNYRNMDSITMINELGSLNFYKNVETDVYFNVVNSYAVAFLHSMGVKKITLSYELTIEQIKTLIDNYKSRYKKHPNLEVVVYSYPIVMISKFDLIKKYNIKGIAYLKDKYKNKFKIESRNNLMSIYFYKPLVIDNIDYLYKIGVNNLRIELDDTLEGLKVLKMK